MKFENVRVFNFEGALRGMRNPKNSWNMSDSAFGIADINWLEEDYDVAIEWVKFQHPDWVEEETQGFHQEVERIDEWLVKNGNLHMEDDCVEFAFIGPKDMRLATTLLRSGPEHRKFLRQIFVSVDITAPLYWWKEFDTYKVGTVANSTSTMHKLTSKPITLECFEIDDFQNMIYPESEQREDLKYPIDPDFVQMCLIPYLEYLRQKYLETKDTVYWKELVRWLPNGWLQTRTVTMNYENLMSICSRSQRRFHKLTEWSNTDPDMGQSFIKFAHDLPYADYFIFNDELSEEQQKLTII